MRFVALLLAFTLTTSLACAAAGVALGSRNPQLALRATDDPDTPADEQDEEREFDHTHALLDELLRKHVVAGWVDYKGILEDRKPLRRYLRRVHRVTPEQMEGWTREQRFAFWINVYNAHVIELVIENYPVKSIKDIGGAVFDRVWDKEFIEMSAFHPDGDDDLLSLNDIEHGILRPQFKDSRVHAAINCASISCPVLMAGAYVADELDEQLERQMRIFVNDRERNRIDPLNSQLQISEIFKWFEEDFVRDRGSVREYLIHYATKDATEFLEHNDLRYLKYDWSLNDIEENRL